MTSRLVVIVALLSAPALGCGAGEIGATGGEGAGAGVVTGATGSASTSNETLSVRIAAPADGVVVAGVVDVELEVAGPVERVELTANGQAVCVLTTAPWRCAWDATRLHDNALPAPSHDLDFGYYFVEGKYGDYRAEVNGYTNLYYALAWAGYVTDNPWGDLFSESLAKAEQ